MAFPTSVNDQITDSITQASVSTLAHAPAQAMAALYQSAAQAHATAAHNAAAHQQNMNTLSATVMASAASALLGTGSQR